MSLTSFGVDFGTTNTVVVKASADGSVEPLHLGDEGYVRDVHPTVIAFEAEDDRGRTTLMAETGDEAISLAARYPDDFRYVQSFKNHVASTKFSGTTILGKRFEFSGIFSSFLRRSGIADAINDTAGPKRVIVGRPAVFFGESPDEELAVSRYRAAFEAAGIADFDLALEPVGGAFAFFRAVRTNLCALIADFGGGTSDFVIVRFTLSGSGVETEVLSHAGIGIAGDVFDNRIVENMLLRHFGAGTRYRADGKWLPVPKIFFTGLSQWHQVTQLRSSKYLTNLRDILKTSDAPEKIKRLLNVLNGNKGLTISRAVAEAKAVLSNRDTAELQIDLDDVILQETITRRDFEAWIADDVRRISDRVGQVVEASGLKDTDIDQIFLTGGTSFVPAVNALFTERFGDHKVTVGERFGAVAEGLSLIGLEENFGYWTSSD